MQEGLVVAEPAKIERAPQQLSPMEMIQVAFDAAIKQGSAMEVVNVILEQQKWMIQHNEEEAFNAALKRIQRKLKKIPKRGWNKETKSHYALAEDVDDAIQKLLDEEGMTLSFVPEVSERPDEVIIVGTLSLGAYTRRYPLPMPADGKGAKGGGVMSRTHATGSAITYGKRYLKDMIFDLRFTGKDDDGNGAGASRLSDQEFIQWRDAISSAANVDELKKRFFAAREAAHKANDNDSENAFIAEKDKRYRYLQGGAQ